MTFTVVRMKKNFLFLIIALSLVACGDFLNSEKEITTKTSTEGNGGLQKNPFPPGYENPNEGDFTEEKMLVNIGVNVIAKGVRSFSLQSELLKEEIDSYCKAMEFGGDIIRTQHGAREQWKKATLAFHYIDAFPVGPIQEKGRYLIDNIYAWPYLDQCGIDRQVVNMANTGSIGSQLVFTQKGLGALEYLLFEPSFISQCNARRFPETAEWSRKKENAKQLDRCKTALVLAEDLWDKARELDQRWDTKEGNYTKSLIDGSVYSSTKEATNTFTDALFTLEKMKDQRLGKPLGLHKDCTNENKKCSASAEHTWSGIALEAVEARLEGFRDAFFGGALRDAKSFGLDDFLVSRGHAAVAETMGNHLDQAIASVRSFEGQGTLQEQIEKMDAALCAASTSADRKEPICAFFQDVRSITSMLKIEVMALLSLRAPSEHAGDND